MPLAQKERTKTEKRGVKGVNEEREREKARRNRERRGTGVKERDRRRKCERRRGDRNERSVRFTMLDSVPAKLID